MCPIDIGWIGDMLDDCSQINELDDFCPIFEAFKHHILRFKVTIDEIQFRQIGKGWQNIQNVTDRLWNVKGTMMLLHNLLQAFAMHIFHHNIAMDTNRDKVIDRDNTGMLDSSQKLTFLHALS